MRDFVAFAVDTSDETADPAAWVIDARYFRARFGEFSALRLIREHARETRSEDVGSGSTAFEVSVGDHPHCASPPMPAPRGLDEALRVSIEPTQRSTDSCLEWFSVDLFLDADGTISAVTLDLWEP